MLVLLEHELLAVLPGLERERPVADDVGRLGPLVAVLLHRRAVGRKCREIGAQHGEVAPRSFEGDLERPVVLGLHPHVLRVRSLLHVERLGALDVVEVARVWIGAGRIHLTLPRPLEIARGARRAVRPSRVLADLERPDGAVLVRGDLARHVWHRLEVRGELHETGEQRRDARAIEILVVVVAGRVVLPPSASANPQRLVLGELLAGRELGRGGRGERVESGRAHRGQPARDLQELATAEPARAEALGEQLHVFVGDGWSHDYLLGR